VVNLHHGLGPRGEEQRSHNSLPSEWNTRSSARWKRRASTFRQPGELRGHRAIRGELCHGVPIGGPGSRKNGCAMASRAVSILCLKTAINLIGIFHLVSRS
jgi:hypothetical protein